MIIIVNRESRIV